MSEEVKATMQVFADGMVETSKKIETLVEAQRKLEESLASLNLRIHSAAREERDRSIALDRLIRAIGRKPK
jgi:hypothetical protein